MNTVWRRVSTAAAVLAAAAAIGAAPAYATTPGNTPTPPPAHPAATATVTPYDPAGTVRANFYEDEDGYRTAHPFSQPINPSGGINQYSEYVYCKVWGDQVGSGGSYNHWWLRTDLDWTYPNMPWQNQYVPAYGLTGGNNYQNDSAYDQNGNVIRTC
jgi:hypothetical protein